MNHQETIKTLLDNKKITTLSILYGTDFEPYACIEYQDKNQSTHDILLDLQDLPWLLHPFSIVTMRGVPYVRLRLPNGYRYLHQVISEAPAGHVTHHTRFTVDNRRQSLQIVPLGIHSQFHRNLKIKEIRKDII